MRLYLIRHGEAEDEPEDAVGGQKDYPLTAHGRMQVKKLKERLSHTSFDAVYTSPLSRAKETARILLEGRSLTPIVQPELKELDWGDLTGLTNSEAFEKYREIFDALKRGEDPQFPNGERRSDLWNRVRRCMDVTIARHFTSEAVLVVTHGGPIEAALEYLFGHKGDNDKNFAVSEASLSCLEITPESTQILFLNDISHLR